MLLYCCMNGLCGIFLIISVFDFFNDLVVVVGVGILCLVEVDGPFILIII